MPSVLEHSLENDETVECISQFAMLFRVCNRSGADLAGTLRVQRDWMWSTLACRNESDGAWILISPSTI